MSSERLDSLRARWRDAARQNGVNPRDVDLLLIDLLGRSQSYLISHGDERVDPAALETLMARRLAREPLQYLRGHVEFYGREFAVDPRALIPRPETELLVEMVLLRAPRAATVVDIGSGSGCIAITLTLERPDLRLVATDVSPAALALARHNARTLSAPVSFVACDILEAFARPFDVVVSNPPYIPSDEVELLEPEVRLHEPRGALTPGPRGTEVIERIFDAANDALVFLEIGFGQEPAVRQLAAARGNHLLEVKDDLAGIPRIVVSSRHVRQ